MVEGATHCIQHQLEMILGNDANGCMSLLDASLIKNIKNIEGLRYKLLLHIGTSVY